MAERPGDDRPADWMLREPPPGDERLAAPAAARNAAPLAAVLERLLPDADSVLEIASGSGQHAVFFAERLPWVTWRPSDTEPTALASIAAWRRLAGLHNLEAPRALDVSAPDWWAGLDPVSAVLCVNMIHISPWQSCLGLLEGAAALLPDEGALILYGPFRREGVETAESNEAFDRSLRQRDPRWGLRRLEAVVEAAAPHGLALAEVVEMPANNLTVALRRSASQADPAGGISGSGPQGL